MRVSIGVVMDPIASIYPHKDSSLAMLLEAQRRGWPIHYMEQQDLFVRDGSAWAYMRPLRVFDDKQRWFELGDPRAAPLESLQVILMRKEPPFNIDYIYSTYVLELAEARGTAVFNQPASLRAANEKLSIAWFPDCSPPSLVSSRIADLRAFLDEHSEIVVKPLDGKGGQSVFRVSHQDLNANVILEVMTRDGCRLVMAQRFLPEISAGDRRILLIEGEPVPGALARIPPPGDSRGNLSVGARGEGVLLSERDRWLCSRMGPTLLERGLIFVGIDVIGDFVTEINVTSPTGIREIDRIFGLNIAEQLLDAIVRRLAP